MSSFETGDDSRIREGERLVIDALLELNRTSEERDVLRVATERAAAIFNVRRVDLVLRDDPPVWKRAAGVNVDDLEVVIDETCGLRERPGTLVEIDDLQTLVEQRPAVDGLVDRGITGFGGASFGLGLEVAGALLLYFERRRRLTESERNWLRYIASALGGSLIRARELASSRAEGAFARALQELVPQIVFRADAAGVVRSLGARWYDYTGLDATRAVEPHPWLRVLHPDDAELVLARIDAGFRSGSAFTVELRLRRRDGAYRWFELRAQPHGTHAEREWYGVVLDIDEPRSAAARERSMLSRLTAALTPRQPAQIAGLAIDAVYLPAEEEAVSGGDWYDVLPLPDGRVLLAVGDVSGRGLAAAATMVRARLVCAAAAVRDPAPQRVLLELNEALLRDRDFPIAAGFALFNPADDSIAYASAGLPPAIVAREDETTEAITSRALPLGVSYDPGLRVVTTRLRRGDLFVLATDGLISHRRDLIAGTDELVAAAHAARARRAPAAAAIRSAILGKGRSNDDTAIVTLRHRANDRLVGRYAR